MTISTKLRVLLMAVLPRLSEKSTVLGLITSLSLVLGVVVAPERVEAIVTLAGLAASLGLILIRETPEGSVAAPATALAVVVAAADVAAPSPPPPVVAQAVGVIKAAL